MKKSDERTARRLSRTCVQDAFRRLTGEPGACLSDKRTMSVLFKSNAPRVLRGGQAIASASVLGALPKRTSASARSRRLIGLIGKHAAILLILLAATGSGCILTSENAGGYTITFGTTLDIASRSSTTDSKSTVKIDLAPSSEFIEAVTRDLEPLPAAANTTRSIDDDETLGSGPETGTAAAFNNDG